MLQDTALVKSIDSARPPVKSLTERLKMTFDPSQLYLPNDLDFDFRYELTSVALALDMRAVTLLRKIQESCRSQTPAQKERFAAYKTLAKGTPIEQFTERTWNPSVDLPESKKHHRSIYPSLTLSVKKDAATDRYMSPYTVKLNAPTVEKSCRVHRKFGSRRLLILNVPIIKGKELCKSTSPEEAFDDTVKWIHSQHKFLGCTWRAFFVDNQVRVRKNETRFQQVHLFAVDGIGSPCSLKNMIDWHIPWRENINSTDLKLFNRYKLALSKTVPGVVLHKEEFVSVPDKTNGGKVMDDGAGRMSYSLAKANALEVGLAEVPSIFQGRISGAKGVWIVVPDDESDCNPHGRNYWITISPSQLKIKPHPRDRDADDESRTFEISSFSKPLRPGSLNTQLITIMHNRGVTREVIADRFRQHSEQYYEALQRVVESTTGLREWLQRYHASARNGEITLTGCVPSQKTDKQALLLDAGFTPKECSVMHELFRQTMKERLTDMAERICPELAESATPFIIPDPYGVLKEGEAMLCLPENFGDSDTTLSSSYIYGRHALVARNPANLPSDMQKIKLCWYPELSRFKNVLIFSTNGNQPLADLLSGGDYDGDKAFITWDSEIVDQFQNYRASLPDTVSPQQCGVKQCSKPLSALIGDGDDPSEVDIDNYLYNCIKFNLRMSLLGQVTELHAKHVYWTSLELSSKDGEGRAALEDKAAIKLGALTSFLVDAPKQGYSLQESDLNKLCAKLRVLQLKDKPAFKKPLTKQTSGDTRNINNFLKYKVAIEEMDRILTDWHERHAHSTRRDEVLISNHDVFREMASSSNVVKQISDKLVQELATIGETWRKTSNNDDLSPSEFTKEVNNLYREYLQIEPLVVEGHEDDTIYTTFDVADSLGMPLWPKIRASYMYHGFHKRLRALPWNMAADELCEIKAKSQGRTVTMTMGMWSALKVDKRVVASMTTWGEIECHDFEDQEDETQYFDAETDLPPYAAASLAGWLKF